VDVLSFFFALFPFGMCGLPSILALIALIDAVRTGADWYWVPIVLFFPVVGPVAYFVVTRTSLGGGASAATADRAQRRWARRRLRELEVQLEHWRGPALLVEAGEALLLLGKVDEAERYLREAVSGDAPVESVNYPLANTLQYQGRYSEALSLLEALTEHDPGFKFGEAELALARCHDECGHRDEAEQHLRSILERHNFIEARVRLARILLAKGDRNEAQLQIDQVRADAESLPRKLMRQQRPWIRAARRLRSGTMSLPKPARQRSGGGARTWVIGAAVVAAAVPLTLFAYFLYSMFALAPWGDGAMETYTRSEELASRLLELDELYPPAARTLPEVAELSADDVALYLGVRSALTPHVAVYTEARQAMREVLTASEDIDGLLFGAAHRSIEATQEFAEAQVVLREAAVEVLENARLGPGRLGQLVGVVEWRWLRRPEALVFGLPGHDRDPLTQSRTQLGYYSEDHVSLDDETYGRQWRVARERLEARIASFEEEASSRTGISETTLDLLEQHRAELSGFDTSELEPLLFITDAIIVTD
jgi:hypothetical protein